MIWVEMMGPSGIGKSYWYKYLTKKYWHITLEGVLSRYAQMAYTDLSRRGKLKYIIKGLGVLPQKYHKGLRDEVVRAAIRKHGKLQPIAGDRLSQDDIRKYLDVLWRSNAQLRDPIRRIKMVSHVLNKRLPKFMAVDRLSQGKEIVVFEGGILHNNRGITKEYVDDWPEALVPDFILRLIARDEYIYTNRKKRISSGGGTFIERGVPPKELQKMARQASLRYTEKVTLLDKKGANILDVNVMLRDENVRDTIDRHMYHILAQ